LIEDFLAIPPRRSQASELLSGSRDRVTMLVKKLFHPKDVFDVFPFIDAVAGFGFLRSQGGKLRFPKSEDERLDIDDLANLPDAEEKLVRDFRCRHND